MTATTISSRTHRGMTASLTARTPLVAAPLAGRVRVRRPRDDLIRLGAPLDALRKRGGYKRRITPVTPTSLGSPSHSAIIPRSAPVPPSHSGDAPPVIDSQSLLQDLTEPQAAAVQHVDGPLLIIAGAGSGKTRVLTRRVANL
ncbi:MAG TPA: UvrD-helicase domain-containing protein, partial [Tepidisphaeraceae bacterium]|nr:UvrD-helicase domain-containing protein [Tepidisphaeraceae bacterium]